MKDSGTKARAHKPPEKRNKPMLKNRSGQGGRLVQKPIQRMAVRTIKDNPMIIPYLLEMFKSSAPASCSSAAKTCFPAAPIKTLIATQNAPQITKPCDLLYSNMDKTIRINDNLQSIGDSKIQQESTNLLTPKMLSRFGVKN
jgi:hypothetical protein